MQAAPPAPASALAPTVAVVLPAAAWRWLARGLPWLLLVWAVGFNLVCLWPEVAIQVPSGNDANLHKLALAQVVDALQHGADPADTWLPTIALGYPLFHHYQHLAYLPPALAYLALQGTVSLAQVYAWSLYLLLGLWPLCMYWSLRRLGFGAGTAALAGLLAPLISTNGLYGLDFASYVWRGFGLYTQLWGMLLMPLAIAWGYTALRDGRGYFPAALFLALTLATHTVFGWMTVLSLAVGLLVAPGQGRLWRRGWRLVLLLVLVAVAVSYFLVPFVLDNAYMNRSVWESAWKYDVYGHGWALQVLALGGLFDFGRPSILTVLVGVGLLVCVVRWRGERYRLPAVLAAFWLAIYFGRPTWGVLLDLLPLARELHFHRVIAGFHLAGVWLAAIALGEAWAWLLARRRDLAYLLPAAVATVVLLLPVYQERAGYLDANAALLRANRDAVAAEATDLDALFGALRALPPGRVFAGRAATWGGDYKIGHLSMYHVLNEAGFDMNGFLYHALSLNTDMLMTFDDQRPEQYELYNVRYVVAPDTWEPPEFLQLLGRFGRHRLYAAPTSGYFGIVAVPGALTGGRRTFYAGAEGWLKSDWPARGLHPAVFFGRVWGSWPWEVPLAGTGPLIAQLAEQAEAAHLPAPAPGRIVSERVLRQGYSAVVDLAAPGVVMAKITYHPGLQVAVDGERVAPLLLLPSMVGIPVGAGQHAVQVVYEPPLLRRVLMALGVGLLAAIAVVEWRRAQVAAWLARHGWRRRLVALRRAGRRAAIWQPVASTRARVLAVWPYVGALAVLTVLVGLPLFQLKAMSGHNTLVYLPQLVEFWENLRAGVVVPRWAPDFAHGYGEPQFVFQAPLVYVVGAGVRALGGGALAADNLAAFGCLALAALGMYWLAGSAFGRRGGLVAAAAYLLAPPLLVTLYVRHALTDLAALAALPFAALGLWRLASDGGRGWLLLAALGVAALVLSSAGLALLALPMLVLLAGAVAWGARSPWPLARGAMGLGLGVALAAFFWLPALAERRLVTGEPLHAGLPGYRAHAIDLHQLVFSPWGYGYSVPGPDDGMSFAVGFGQLALWLAAVWLLPRLWRLSRRTGVLVAFGVLVAPLAALLATTLSLPLWDHLPLLQGVVYPWRSLGLVAFATAFLAGAPLLLADRWDATASKNLVALLLALLAALGLPLAHPASYLETTEADLVTAQIASRDSPTGTLFAPAWAQEPPASAATSRITVLSGGGAVRDVRLAPTRYQLEVDVREPSRLRVSQHYYPGWTLYVDGVERPLAVSAPQGLMELELRPGDRRVEIVFEDTPLRAWAAGLSLAALGALLLLPLLGWLVAQRWPAVRGSASAPVLGGPPREPVNTP